VYRCECCVRMCIVFNDRSYNEQATMVDFSIFSPYIYDDSMSFVRHCSKGNVKIV